MLSHETTTKSQIITKIFSLEICQKLRKNRDGWSIGFGENWLIPQYHHVQSILEKYKPNKHERNLIRPTLVFIQQCIIYKNKKEFIVGKEVIDNKSFRMMR